MHGLYHPKERIVKLMGGHEQATQDRPYPFAALIRYISVGLAKRRLKKTREKKVLTRKGCVGKMGYSNLTYFVEAGHETKEVSNSLSLSLSLSILLLCMSSPLYATEFRGLYVEYQLDILMCAKEMAPTALLYIALATDEDSDSSLNKLAVADALTESGSIVFIDPASGDLVPYYQPLAVNGGAIEQESGNLGTFTFQNMRQAILSVE